MECFFLFLRLYFLVLQNLYGAQEDFIVNPFTPFKHLFRVKRLGILNILPSFLVQRPFFLLETLQHLYVFIL